MSQPAQMALTKFHTCVWLKQQTFICHCSESWKFQDQGAGWGPFSWSAHSHHLAVSSHGRKMGRNLVSFSSYKGTILITGVLSVSPQLNQMTSQRPNLWMPSHWGLVFQHNEFWGDISTPFHSTQVLVCCLHCYSIGFSFLLRCLLWSMTYLKVYHLSSEHLRIWGVILLYFIYRFQTSFHRV